MLKVFYQKTKKKVESMGPGIITGVADDDPSGIGTYTQTGAMFGLSQLWLTFFTLPFMIAVQEACGRIAITTGKGLSTLIRENYSKKILFLSVALLVIANTVNIGADLGMMADAVTLIAPINFFHALLFFTFISIFLEVFVDYKTYVKILKWMAMTVFAYVIAAISINHDWSIIFKSLFTPHFQFTESYLLNIVAMLGTTISPYLFFWQMDEEIEEEKSNGTLTSNIKSSKKAISGMRADTAVGMFVSNLITFFIIITANATLHQNGITDVTSAKDLADALRPIAGDFAYILLAVGVIGTGLLAVPILAGSAAYAVSEATKMRGSLSDKWNEARGFYSVIIIATLAGISINFFEISPVKLLYIAAITNGFLAPPLLYIIWHLGNNKKLMGKNKNSKLSNTLLGIITFVMSLGALALLFTLVY